MVMQSCVEYFLKKKLNKFNFQKNERNSIHSRKEISNSSVIWSNDSPIQFDVKTVQLYTILPPPLPPSPQQQLQQQANLNLPNSTSSSLNASIIYDNMTLNDIHYVPFQVTSTLKSNSNNSNNQSTTYYVIGYESCLCRISVRKELRGGKSYKKLGYVDYNLADYIFKYQQELFYYQLVNNYNSANTNNYQSNTYEYCVNRILKEYDSSSGGKSKSKKNQQRSDNSYLKINIKIIDPLLQTNNNNNANSIKQSVNILSKARGNSLTNKSQMNKSNECATAIIVAQQLDDSIQFDELTNEEKANLSITSDKNVVQNDSKEKELKAQTDMQQIDNHKSDSLISTRNRNMSSASAASSSSKSSVASSVSPTTVARSFSLPLPVNNSVALIKLDDAPESDSNTNMQTDIMNANDCADSNLDKAGPILTISNSNYHKHNRTCSNGSIKSNISFDFIIKNRNKKLIDDINSTSSSSSGIQFQTQLQQQNLYNKDYSPSTNMQFNNNSQSMLLSYSSPNNFGGTNINNMSSTMPKQALITNPVETNEINYMTTPASHVNHSKIEPANLRIIETRIDANEIISQIELELNNRLNNQK